MPAECVALPDDASNECSNIGYCTFFQSYGKDQKYRAAVSGFVRMYCKGPRQDSCVRKSASKQLGGPHLVPANMLPTGLPLFGTNDSEWSEHARKAARKVKE
jgi:hypothetical protein